MHIILTRPPKAIFPKATIYYLKWIARKVLGKTRGPEAVLQSLQRGLNELSFPYKINTKPEPGDTVHVISNIEALRYAIEQKKKGLISKLIAGPNLVVMPDEYNKILTSPEIDHILIVSKWIRDLYDLVLPEIKSKTHIWPAGVRVPPLNQSVESGVRTTSISSASSSPASPIPLSCIVFKKTVPQNIFESVINGLQSKNIQYKVLEYGSFKQDEYFSLLQQNDFMVYLQESESQGIALQEAWIRDIPTLVWNKGTYRSPGGHDIVGNVAAPFMTDEAGILFDNEVNFDKSLELFIEKIKSDNPFTPRQYCIDHLSDKASAQIYIDIISKDH